MDNPNLRNMENVYGKLYFRVGQALMALLFLTISVVFVYVYFFTDEYHSENILYTMSFIPIGMIGLYYAVELIKVKGEYDSDIIFFYTPWSGEKKEKWEDLIHVTTNNYIGWHKLTFISGKTIRLSSLLVNHSKVIHHLRNLGHFVEEIDSNK